MQGVGALANAQKPKHLSLGLFPRRTPKTLPDVLAGTSPTQQLTRTGAAGSGRSRTAVSTERHEGCGPPREARGPQYPGTRDGGLDGCLVHGKHLDPQARNAVVDVGGSSPQTPVATSSRAPATPTSIQDASAGLDRRKTQQEKNKTHIQMRTYVNTEPKTQDVSLNNHYD